MGDTKGLVERYAGEKKDFSIAYKPGSWGEKDYMH